MLKGGGPFVEDLWEEISFDCDNKPDLRIEPMEIKLVSKCVRCLVREAVITVANGEN